MEEGHRQRAKPGVAKAKSLEEQTSLEMRLPLLHGSYGSPARVLSLVGPSYCDITSSSLDLLLNVHCVAMLWTTGRQSSASEKTTFHIWVQASGEMMHWGAVACKERGSAANWECHRADLQI